MELHVEGSISHRVRWYDSTANSLEIDAPEVNPGCKFQR